jgi:hypothetical protein
MDASQYQLMVDLIKGLEVQLYELKKPEVAKEPPFRSEEIKDLAISLAKAQAEMPMAYKSRENPYFKSAYADLGDIVKASRPSLTKYGLSVLQDIIHAQDGSAMLYTILMHISGQWIESRMRILPLKNDPQSMSSYISYLKRISYASLVGVVTGEEDDDAEVAMVQAREIMAKGPSNKYDPKKESSDPITKEQLEELEYELAQYPDIAEEIMDKMRLQSLADLPKSKFMVSITRVREIKQLRNEGRPIK